MLDKLEARFSDARDKAEQFSAATKGVSVAAEKAGKGAEKGAQGIGKFASSLIRIFKYRMIRKVIREIGQAFSEGLTNVRDYSAGLEGEGHRIAAAFENMSGKSLTMKNQIGSAFAELISIVMPLIEQFVSLITKAANVISQFFAALGGNSKYYKAVDASEEVAKNLGSGAKSAKEMRKQLMGFDVINRLDAPTEPSGGGGGASADAAKNQFQYTEIATGIQKIANIIRDNLPAIEAVLGGSLMGVGAILLFSGANIPLGLGLMAAGAVMLGKAAAENWDSVSTKVKTAVASIALIVGGVLIAVGAVLAFSGVNIPLGIGLLAAGVASVAAAGVAWGKLPTELKTQVAEIALIVGAALAALGFIFLLTGNIPLGLGMILAGGVGVGMALSFGDNALLNKLKQKWDGIKTWFNEHVKKYFTADYWQQKIEEAGGGLIGGVAAVVQTVREMFSGLSDFISRVWQSLSGGFHVELDYGGGMIVPQYATGGFPEDGLFMANHGELVGQFSNGNTAVANNAEIVEGIRRGVYDAVSSAMSNNRSQQDVRVYLDGKQISNAVTRNQRNTDRAMGAVYG